MAFLIKNYKIYFGKSLGNSSLQFHIKICYNEKDTDNMEELSTWLFCGT